MFYSSEEILMLRECKQLFEHNISVFLSFAFDQIEQQLSPLLFAFLILHACEYPTNLL